MVRKEGQIALPLPQWRKSKPEHVYSIIEIFSKFSFLNDSFEVSIPGGYHTNGSASGFGGPERAKLAVLEEAQQFHLGREWQGIHFVEQHRTPVSFSNEPDPILDGSGKGAAVVAEKFALHERFGDRTAVHRHKRLSGPITEIVNGPSKDFLARTRFSSDEDGCIARRNAVKFLHLDEQEGALTDNTPEADARLNSGYRLVSATHRMHQSAQPRHKILRAIRRQEKVRCTMREYLVNPVSGESARCDQNRPMGITQPKPSKKRFDNGCFSGSEDDYHRAGTENRYIRFRRHPVLSAGRELEAPPCKTIGIFERGAQFRFLGIGLVVGVEADSKVLIVW